MYFGKLSELSLQFCYTLSFTLNYVEKANVNLLTKICNTFCFVKTRVKGGGGVKGCFEIFQKIISIGREGLPS